VADTRFLGLRLDYRQPGHNPAFPIQNRVREGLPTIRPERIKFGHRLEIVRN